MRVYPVNTINTYNIKNKLKHFILKEKTTKMMLTDNGFFMNIRNELHIFKFNFKEKSNILENYINNKDFILTHDKWIKIDKRYKLPIAHKIVDSNILRFTIRKDAPVEFICEYIDGDLRDYYFTIPENYEMDPLIKEDICSFLTKLD